MAEEAKPKVDRLSRIIAVVALIISAASFYYAYFDNREDFIVSGRVEQTPGGQIGIEHLGILLVFTNKGKLPVAVADVTLGVNYGKGAKIEDATDPVIEGYLRFRNPYVDSGAKLNMQNGTKYIMYAPQSTTLNNKDTSRAAFLVEGNNVALLRTTFQPAPIDVPTEGPIVLSLAIRYFTQEGYERMSVVPLFQLDSPDGKGIRYGPVQSSAFTRLLPYF